MHLRLRHLSLVPVIAVLVAIGTPSAAAGTGSGAGTAPKAAKGWPKSAATPRALRPLAIIAGRKAR